MNMREHIFNLLVILTLIALCVWVASSIPQYQGDDMEGGPPLSLIMGC